MALFDRPNLPVQWGDYSRDYKLFFIWEASLFAVIAVSPSGVFNGLSDAVYYGVAGGWLALLAGIAVQYRIKQNWKWPGLSPLGTAGALLVCALMAVFLVVFMHNFLPVRRATMPMIAFAVSIVAFNILSALKLMQRSKEEFERYCAPDGAFPASKSGADRPVDPFWMRAVRGTYAAVFVLVWLEAMAFFYFHQRFEAQGTLQPTASRTQSVNEHGTLIYFTDDQANLDKLLQTLMMIGIPSVILTGFLLHFVVGVPMFGNMQASRGLLGLRDD